MQRPEIVRRGDPAWSPEIKNAKERKMKMRKTMFRWLIALAIVVPCMVVTASAASGSVVASGSCGSNVTYTLWSDGELVISGNGAMYSYDYSYSDKYPWYSIRDSIKTVTIENGVTNVGSYAFAYYYPALIEVEIGTGVTDIGECAFFRCGALTDVAIWGKVSAVGDHAFSECTALANVTLGEDVVALGEAMFDECGSLMSIAIPSGVKEIPESAFFLCKNLQSVTTYNGLESIGWQAFTDCTSLAEFVIPESVTSIDRYAFEGCSALDNVVLPNGLTSVGREAFKKCKSLTSIVVPDSVTELGEGVFYYCSNLVSATLGDGITEIGMHTFVGCTKLTQVVLPANLTSIGDGAFSGCASLTDVTIPNGVTSIGASAFIECNGLTRVVIPDSVMMIGNYAFDSNSALTEVIVGRGVNSIGEDAFWSCENLQRVEFAGNMPAEVASKAFKFCNNLTFYYHEGTEGWDVGDTWMGRPLAVQPHTESVLGAILPTCEEHGLTEGSCCAVCKAVLSAQQVVPALGHDYEDHAEKKPTTEEAGWRAYQTCSRCDYSTYEELPKMEVFDVVVGGSVGGSVVLDKVTGTAGEEVTVTITPPKGYVVKEILIDGVPIVGTTFTITGDHEVVVTYEKIPFGYFSLQVVNTIVVDGQEVQICRWVWTPFEE